MTAGLGWANNGAWGGGENPFRVPAPTSHKYAPGAYPTTPIGQKQLEAEQNRSNAFTYYNQGYGVQPMQNYGKWLQSVYGQVSTGYEAALAENPDLSFAKYYALIYPQLQQAFNDLTPEGRGESVTRYVAPARVIPRGYGG